MPLTSKIFMPIQNFISMGGKGTPSHVCVECLRLKRITYELAL